jgi:hypothetical protein
MLDFPNTALTVFAVVIAIAQSMFPPLVTAGLAVLGILALFIALRGERRRD